MPPSECYIHLHKLIIPSLPIFNGFRVVYGLYIFESDRIKVIVIITVTELIYVSWTTI